MTCAAVVVIPTRNRSSIAKNAIRSVLGRDSNVSVLVSDNSTSTEEVEALHRYCDESGSDKLRYVRPHTSLAMSDHWQWAIERSLAEYPSASHFAYLTDRMMFKATALDDVMRLVAQHPDRIVTYNHDRIIDNANPVRIQRYPGTGRLLELETSRLIDLYASAIIHPSFPRMLNCFVPRALLERIHERFGSVFASVAPDFNFCCRALDTEQSILFYDSSPIFHYALGRSHGASISRGEMTADRVDFFSTLPSKTLAASKSDVLTSFATVGSTIFREYDSFVRETRSERFRPLDEAACLRLLASEVNELENPELQRQLRQQLIVRGWAPVEERGSATGQIGTFAAKSLSPRAIARKLRSVLVGPTMQPLWMFAGRHLAWPVPSDCRFEFNELDAAIEFMNRFPGRAMRRSSRQDALLHPRVLPG